jgi:type IX secretion system PorP/SprF family membrane protein
MIKRLTFLSLFMALFAGISINSSAQDPEFSQNFSNPLYLNPAYAGSLGCSRIAADFRDQWPELEGNYISTSTSYDQYFSKLSGGLGLIYTSDNAGNGFITSNIINGIYAFNLNISQNLHIRPAINIGYGRQHIDWKFTAPTQNYVKTSYYFNAGAGMLIAYKNFISGISFDHINRPDIGFFGTSRLPSKLTLHCNYQFDISDKAYLLPGMIFQHQQDFHTLIPSMMVKISHIKFGAAIRIGYNNPDCLTGMIGFVNKWISIGYSYDYTVSKLSNATAGSHEISAVFKFNCKNDKEKFGITHLYGF